jgi:hypothetical protein
MDCPNCQEDLVDNKCLMCEGEFLVIDGEICGDSYPMEDEIQAELDRIFANNSVNSWNILILAAIILNVISFPFFMN